MFAGETYEPFTQKIEKHKKNVVGNYKSFNFNTIWYDDKMGKVKSELDNITQLYQSKKDNQSN